MKLNYSFLQKKCSTVCCLLLMSFFAVSCLEKDVYEAPANEGEADGSANLFDFSTKKEVTVNLDYSTNYEVPFEAYYVNPLTIDADKSYEKNLSLKPFIEGKTDANGKLKLILPDMPAGQKDIYIYSPTLLVPRLLHAEIQGSEVVLTQDSKVAGLSRSVTRASAVGEYYKKWQPRNCTYSQPLGEWDKAGNASYLNQGEEIDKHKLEITEKFKRTIKGTLETDVPSYGQYLTHEYITISEEANVYINFVAHNSERNNALAYYTLAKGEKEPSINTPPTNFAVAFPNLLATELKQGDVIQLKYYDKAAKQWTTKFPAGTRIGFVLLVDAFQNEGLNKNVNLVYSRKLYNSYEINKLGNIDGSDAADRPHMFAFTADDKLVLSFEDMPWHERRVKGQPAHGDFSDDIFTITANPIKALPDDVNPGVDPDEPEVDKPDMSITSAGILAFEDNWPKAGDYDLNDVVIAYQRTFNMKDLGDFEYQVLSIDEVYTFKHDGATFKNGFGYEMGAGIQREDVEVEITTEKKFNGQGLDLALSKATVMLIDNARNLEAGTTYKVHTTIKPGKKYVYSDFHFKPYNPFIVVMGYGNANLLASGRVEVHLPKNYEPTPKADRSKLGTENDKSLVNGSTYYYIRSGNYPFALEITAAYGTDDIPNFCIPEEGKPIDVTYPKFNDWVKNPGTNANWWK